MITVQRLSNDDKKLSAICIVVDGEESIAEFQTMVQRGCGLWPDASADMKAFADEVTHGEHLQNYQQLYGKSK